MSNRMVESVERIKGVCDNDKALVMAFQAGDSNAFDELVLRHKDRVFNMCYRFFGDYEEANDSAQDVFIKVYTSLIGFRGESAFSTWLYRITLNICRNKLKSLSYRFKSKRASMGNVHEPEKGGSILDIADTSRSPANCLEKKEKEVLIQDAINALPPSQKTVIVLRHIEELSYEEIAEVTGFTLGTVKSKIARARLRLRDKLKGVL